MRSTTRFNATFGSKIIQPYYGEGDEGSEGGEGEGSENNEGGEGGENKSDPPPKTFTQDDVDNIVKKRFVKEKKEKQVLIEKLKQLETSASISKEDREKLNGQIEELENSLLTKEQQAAKEKKQLEEAHAKRLKSIEEERGVWKSRYETTLIDNALMESAANASAVSPTQLHSMLRSNAYLAEDKDDGGNPIGTFTPRVKFSGYDPDAGETDSEGKLKVIQLDLPINEAIEKIKKDGLNSNLFRHGATAGTGQKVSGQGGSGSGEPTLEQYGGNHAKFSEAYVKWRKTHEVDGTQID
jgi:hypothetical protein